VPDPLATSLHEEVRLVIPAAPELLRVARLTAAGLANRLGFTYDEIEDVKIAVDELCFALVGTRGRPGTLELTYVMEDGQLTISCSGRLPGGAEPAPSDLSRQILSAVVDSYDVGAANGLVHFSLVKRKARS
jgi:hypothetical protein